MKNAIAKIVSVQNSKIVDVIAQEQHKVVVKQAKAVVNHKGLLQEALFYFRETDFS